MSKAKELFKGKPSKMLKVLEEGTAFDISIWAKPPSANARKIWLQSMTTVADLEESGKDNDAIEKMAELGINLVLITNCEESGIPFFTNEDKTFLSVDLDQGYLDMMIIAGADMINLPDRLKQGLMLNMGSDEDTEEPEKKPTVQVESSSQTTQPNPQE